MSHLRDMLAAMGRREAIDDALRSLVAGWSAGDERRTRAAIDALRAPHLAELVDHGLVDLVHDAGERARQKRWRTDDVLRLARRRKVLPPAAEPLLDAAMRGSAVTASGPSALALDRVDRAEAIALAVATVVFLLDLPALPELADPFPEVDDPEQARMLEKVRALLAKAESTSYEEEAEAFTAKAQELMARYAIDQALLDARGGIAATAGGAAVAAGIRIGIDEPYATPKALLLARIARENRCRAVWSEGLGLATVFGAPGDLRSVEVLFTSLLLQAVAAMQRAGSQVDRRGRSRTRSFRHAFLLAFAERIGERLREANAAAEAAALEEVGGDFLPVLASRAEAAERARAAAFPQTSRMRTSMSNAAGYVAGRAAADVASLDRGARLPPT